MYKHVDEFDLLPLTHTNKKTITTFTTTTTTTTTTTKDKKVHLASAPRKEFRYVV